ncbi:uncharacterized protein LOC101166101 [Oryzias latipes]|uniref:uncharacterized protein LOC101166101 n=1 Tax=Oryzias latipes TaxID=8090 RepID=UPI0002A4C3F2|nr:uncharacterized protein LOC101166101 [Oryzias latipes]
MAPIGMVSTLSWFGPLMFILSAVAFMLLSILLITLCTNCQKKSSSSYGMNQTKNSNGNTEISRGGSNEPDGVVNTNWRNHSTMPPLTLERTKTRSTQSQPVNSGH